MYFARNTFGITGLNNSFYNSHAWHALGVIPQCADCRSFDPEIKIEREIAAHHGISTTTTTVHHHSTRNRCITTPKFKTFQNAYSLG